MVFRMTFLCGSRGTCIVNYLLTQYDIFEYIKEFTVCSFTQFSDHAPLHIIFNTNILQDDSSTQESKCRLSEHFVWNEEFKYLCLEA